jgi:RHS repeat-associated protein
VLVDGSNSYLYGQGKIAQEGVEIEYFLGDALNSVRQLVDGTAEVTLTQSYEPYGSELSSVGDGESIFNFTGEVKDSYIKLIYLRSRYMSVDTGRFVTKDVWDGDYTTPMSYNAWLYVLNNPTNLTDPSGERPDQQLDYSITPCNEKTRYCIFTGGPFKGFFIDTDHLRASRQRAKTILDHLNDYQGVEEPLKVEGELISFLPYNRWYMTFIPENTGKTIIRDEGLGILMNYETNLERFEFLDPSCLLSPSVLFPHRCSSYSNEDLPSAYLGYYLRAKQKDFNWLIEQLDGNGGNSYGSTIFPSEYAGTSLDAKRCFVGLCGDENPYNKCFNPKVLDALKDNYTYLSWPGELSDISPSSNYWREMMRPVRR